MRHASEYPIRPLIVGFRRTLRHLSACRNRRRTQHAAAQVAGNPSGSESHSAVTGDGAGRPTA